MKSKVYTKTGDQGLTSLVSGNRIEKSNIRIDLYGEVDELNSMLGFALSLLPSDSFDHEKVFLQRIQSSLFDLGSNLACEVENRSKYKLPKITVDLISSLENEIDRMDGELEPLKNFILPGGASAAATFHLCRTMARKVERLLVSFHRETTEDLPENSLVYLNRLSDYFFVLSRYVNKRLNVKEQLWIPH